MCNTTTTGKTCLYRQTIMMGINANLIPANMRITWNIFSKVTKYCHINSLIVLCLSLSSPIFHSIYSPHSDTPLLNSVTFPHLWLHFTTPPSFLLILSLSVERGIFPFFPSPLPVSPGRWCACTITVTTKWSRTPSCRPGYRMRPRRALWTYPSLVSLPANVNNTMDYKSGTISDSRLLFDVLCGQHKKLNRNF